MEDKIIALKYNEDGTYSKGVTGITWEQVDENQLKASFKELSNQEEDLTNTINDVQGKLQEVQTNLNLYSEIQDNLFPEEESDEQESQI